MSSSTPTKEITNYKWEINNFANSGDQFATFSYASNDEIEFKLACYPNQNYSNCKYVFLYLILKKTNKDPLKIRFCMSILNANGDKCFTTKKRVEHFSIKSKIICSKEIKWKRDYFLDPSNGFLVNGKLVTCWEIEEIGSASKRTVSGTQLDLDRMSQDYQTLLESGKMSDAVLVVGDKELPVHKLILSTRSPVFEAMFDSTAKEGQQNCVEINDIEVNVLEKLLKYIYVGKVESLDLFAEELLAAADKYQLDSLKIICEKFLCTTVITTESVSELLLLADLHQATELNDKCLDYIAENGTQVMVTEGWKRVCAKTSLTTKVFERMSLKISGSKTKKVK